MNPENPTYPTFDERDLPIVEAQSVLDGEIASVLRNAKLDLLQKRLLKWLSTPLADCGQMIRWLGGATFQYRDEPVSEAIIRALPPVAHPFEPQAHVVLRTRMEEVTSWLISNSQEWHKLGGPTWYELFALLERLHAAEYFPELIQQLRVTCEGYVNQNRPLFYGDREAATVFTRLVAASQRANELIPRWMNIIAGKTDPVLRCPNAINAFGYLLSNPIPIDVGRFEEALASFCRRIQGQIKEDHLLAEQGIRLGKKIARECFDFRGKFIFAIEQLRPQFQWLPKQFDWLPNDGARAVLIAAQNDLALTGELRRLTAGDPMLELEYELAVLANERALKNAKLSPKYNEYYQENINRRDTMRAGQYQSTACLLPPALGNPLLSPGELIDKLLMLSVPLCV